MILSQLNLTHFKNYGDSKFHFDGGINCVVGKNGLGKTNLLDAIHYLAFAKTAFSTTDAQNVLHNESTFTIYGVLEDDLVVACQYQIRKGKTLKVNQQEEKKISNHVGKIPLVMTTPDDSDIIREGSEFRRKFFDEGISQIDPAYLDDLIAYNSVLRQRNEHLKQSEQPNQVNHKLLDTYDSQLIPVAKRIGSRRKQFLVDYFEFFKENYTSLFPGKEIPEIEFKSDATLDNYEELFKKSRQRDTIMQRTLVGIHRDQYEFILNGSPIKKFGSQGQQKTFIVALRLAEFDMLKKHLGTTPLVLLDDIFDKLDDDRIHALVDLLDDESRFQQVFITDARKERSKAFFKKRNVNFIELS
jgi:DNA replication and repair protein RecF